MTVEQIQSVASTTPFRPFELETAGGRCVAVERPNCIFFAPGNPNIAIYSRPKDVIQLVNANDVASLLIKPPANT